MALKLANNAISRPAGAIDDVQTTIPLLAGTGSKFPTLAGGDWHPLTVVKSDGSFEIMRVTARSTDTFTVIRGQEGTTALAFGANDRVELRLTKAVIDYLWSPDNDGSGSGLDADLVRGIAPATAATATTLVQRTATGGINAADTVVTTLTASGGITGNVTGNITGSQSGGSVAATTLSASALATLSAGANVAGRSRFDAADMKVQALGAGSGARTLDQSVANYFSATVSGATAFTFSNPAAAGFAGGFMLELTNGGASAVSWPASVRWAGGVAPVLTASGVDVLVFFTDDSGANWRGSVAIKDSK